MKKLLFTLISILLLSSFSNNTNKTIVLKNIEGTLLQSYPVINQVNDQYIVTFTVDAATVIISNLGVKDTRINLVSNGNSGVIVKKTLTFNTGNLGFNSYFENSFDIASNNNEGMYISSYTEVRKKPYYIDEDGDNPRPVKEEEKI